MTNKNKLLKITVASLSSICIIFLVAHLSTEGQTDVPPPIIEPAPTHPIIESENVIANSIKKDIIVFDNADEELEKLEDLEDLEEVKEEIKEVVEEEIEEEETEVLEVEEETETEKELEELHEFTENKEVTEEIPQPQVEIIITNDEKLTTIASIAQSVYTKSGSHKGWYSNNGKLYNHYQNRNVTIEDLISDGSLDRSMATDCELLLVNGTDISYFPNSNVPSEYRKLGVFTASKSENNYIINSPSGTVATLSSDNYQALLSLYNQNHGTSGRLSSNSEEYKRIINYISLFHGRFDEYFVREMRVDNKYAVVVFSSSTNSSAVRQHILRNDNNFWEVVYADVQNLAYPVTEIKHKLPDFNLNLLPSYNLASWKNSITSTQGGAIAALYQLRAISNESEIYYLCATNTCAYVVLNSGVAYACYTEDNVWKAQEVSSDYEARNILKTKTGMDYGFIILDD